MSKRIIILAAGEARRFEGKPKQLLPVSDGETILSRMIRQCYDRDFNSEIFVMTHLPEIEEAVYNIGDPLTCKPKERQYTCSTILSSNFLWPGYQVVILLGDVYYTRDTMDKIFSFPYQRPHLKFFASVNEVFAFSFTVNFGSAISYHLRTIIQNARSQSDGKVRRLMEKYDPEHWEEIHDHTTDIDTPKQYNVFKRDVIDGRKYKLDDRKFSYSDKPSQNKEEGV